MSVKTPRAANAQTAVTLPADRAEDRLSVAIVGGGISGLALAGWLSREGVGKFRVFEKSDAPGGVIGSIQTKGFTFERGPNTVLDKYDSIGELIDWAGVGDDILRAPMKGQARYIWHGGGLHELPSGPGAFLTTGLLGVGGKLRLLAEPFIRSFAADEPLRDLVVRRIGLQAYERAFEPMVYGIWAGDPANMSAEASFPILKELERDGGSFARGMIRRMKRIKRERAPGEKRRQTSMISFAGGLARLTEGMAAKLGDKYEGGSKVISIEPAPGGGFILRKIGAGGARQIVADRVVISGEAWNTAKLIEHLDGPLADRMAKISYCPLAVIGLGVPSDSLRLPRGFGFLAARDQGLRVLGCIFNSGFLPGRAPEGHEALTVMIGGEIDPQTARLGDEELLELVRADLNKALGWNGTISAHHIERWERAIPRYGLDHAELMSSIDACEQRHDGLTLFGNWRAGTAIGERIERARELAGTLAREAATSRTDKI